MTPLFLSTPLIKLKSFENSQKSKAAKVVLGCKMHTLTRFQNIQQVFLKIEYLIEWDIKEILSRIAHFLSLFLWPWRQSPCSYLKSN